MGGGRGSTGRDVAPGALPASASGFGPPAGAGAPGSSPASTSAGAAAVRDARGRSERGERERRPREGRPERDGARRRERDDRDRGGRRPGRAEGGPAEAPLESREPRETREPARSRGATFGPVMTGASVPETISGTLEPVAAGGPTRPPSNRFRGSEPAEKEFWEIWSEEKSAAAPPSAAAPQMEGSVAAVAVEFPTTPSAPRGFEPAGPSLPEGMARLYLNLGRKDGAGDAQVRDLLREHASFEGPLQIEIMNTHTYLNVPTDAADRLCSALTGKQLGDRDLLCERARPRR